ncbi:MAG: hypothetical protein Fur0046_17590 [Cyanobacteria bacterium J069]|nr:MAG: hypothetical protein D6742_01025 [Cyanobacteria bacterium J069]
MQKVSSSRTPGSAQGAFKFKYSANFEFCDKTGADKLSHAHAWRQAEGNFTDLATHISKGLPWMPALLDSGSNRKKTASNYAEVIAADIDDDWTIQQAKDHPFVAAHCGLGIESSSSTSERPKFRLVFRLAAPGSWAQSPAGLAGGCLIC